VTTPDEVANSTSGNAGGEPVADAGADANACNDEPYVSDGEWTVHTSDAAAAVGPDEAGPPSDVGAADGPASRI